MAEQRFGQHLLCRPCPHMRAFLLHVWLRFQRHHWCGQRSWDVPMSQVDGHWADADTCIPPWGCVVGRSMHLGSGGKAFPSSYGE
eukprot:3754735-Amphidinium_carterae.1